MVSVILPVYNVAKYLDKCLDSIVNQTYKDLEIILVDDGSKDESPAICDMWASKDPRIKVIHQENAGVSAARNAGIDMATGEYNSFIDPDDYVDLNLYSDVLSNAGDYEIINFGYDYVNENGVITSPMENVFMTANSHEEVIRLNYPKAFGYGKEDILRWNKSGSIIDGRPRSVWQFIFVSDLIKRHNLKFRTDMIIKEDAVFIMETLAYADSILILPKKYYYYLQRSNSAMHHQSREALISNKFTILNIRNELRNKIKEKDGIDILYHYAGANVLSVFEMATLCIGWEKGYKTYKEYINKENIKEAVKLIPVQFKNFKFNLLLFFLKLKLYGLVYLTIKLGMKFGVKTMRFWKV